MKDYRFYPATTLPECFNLKIREACKSCKRYGTKATCPPHCDSVEYYKNLLSTYDNGILVVKKYRIADRSKWEDLGRRSSNEIREALLKYRQNCLRSKHPISVIFGAGSCKLCKECVFPCRFPDKSVVPIEATGIDVRILAKKVADIDITFPVEQQRDFYRIGMMLYDF